MNPPTDRERPALSEAPSIHDEAHLRYDKMTMRNAFIAGAKWARETSPKPALTQGGVVERLESAAENLSPSDPTQYPANVMRAVAAELKLQPTRDAIIEACAVAAEQHDRIGYEWVRDSLWDAILKRAGANVRALKATALERLAGERGGR